LGSIEKQHLNARLIGRRTDPLPVCLVERIARVREDGKAPRRWDCLMQHFYPLGIQFQAEDRNSREGPARTSKAAGIAKLDKVRPEAHHRNSMRELFHRD
jgi:hypothetical protein